MVNSEMLLFVMEELDLLLYTLDGSLMPLEELGFSHDSCDWNFDADPIPSFNNLPVLLLKADSRTKLIIILSYTISN